jgi:poly-gamma-glutamate synthesis protein (capsule biosynthesis protein)
VSASAAVWAASPAGGAADVVAVAERVEEPTRRATFSFTGDTLTLRRVNYSAQQPDGTYDYTHMFERIAPFISWADVAVCHFENPIAPPGQPVIIEPPEMSASWELAPALAGAGFDRCSTASNHSMDRGAAGIDATTNALEAAGIGFHGMARTPAERRAVPFDVNGISVAHLSYSFNFDGNALPAGEPWRSNRIDPAVIVADATQARADGAEAVIVSLHWGATGAVQPTAYQRTIAEAVTAPGVIDLIVGHHAHVLQPIS